MIVADALASGRMIALAGGCRWYSLARRGMLWSEVQVFDALVLGAGVRAEVGDRDYVELVYCLSGAATLEEAPAGGPAAGRDPVDLPAGSVLVLEAGLPTTATAGAAGCALVRLRALPPAVVQALPARRPALEPGPGPGQEGP